MLSLNTKIEYHKNKMYDFKPQREIKGIKKKNSIQKNARNFF